MIGCKKVKATAKELSKEWVTHAWLLPAETALPKVPLTPCSPNLEPLLIDIPDPFGTVGHFCSPFRLL